MAKQALNFFRVATLPQTGVVGGIYFNTDDKTINICTASGSFEAYAGKLKDVNFVTEDGKKYLKITKHDGSEITLDFSDVASASDINSKLQTINTNISDINAEISQNATDIENLGKVVSENHTSVTESIGSLTTQVDNTSNELAQHISSVSTKISDLESTDTAYNTRLEALEGLLGDGDGSVADQINDAIAANNSGHVATELAKKVDLTTYNDYVSANDEAVAAVKKTAEDEVTNRTNAISGLEAKIGGSYTSEATVAMDIQAAKNAAAAAQADIDAFLSATEVGDATIDTLKEIQDWIANDETGSSALVNRVSANETNIAALQGKVNTTGTVTDAIASATATAKTEVTGTLAEDDFKTLEAINDELDRLAGLAGTDSVANQIKAVTDPMKQDITDLETGLQSVSGEISSAVGAAKTELLGGASTDYNTLKKLEDKVKAAQTAAEGGVQSVAGDSYITATTTDGAVKLDTQVGNVTVSPDGAISRVDGLATTKMIEDYVDAKFVWAEF